MGEPGPDEDVFVGKRENGTAVQVAHRGIESPAARGPRVNAATPTSRLGVPPILSRVASA